MLMLKCLNIWRTKTDTALLRIGLTLCPAGLWGKTGVAVSLT